MSAERVLSARELNRALLARQLLLERGAGSIVQTLERVGGLQAQYAPSMYVGLWSRMRDLARDDLTHQLERRSVVQATLMRVTIHLVARGDYWPFALATREARRTSWVRSRRGADSDEEMAAAAERVGERLRAEATIHRKELEEVAGKGRAVGVGLWIDLVRVPPSGTWERRRADLFAAADAWLGAPEVTVRDGVEQLVRRYLAGFGPASVADIQSYTGLPRATFAPALERLELRRFRTESGDELLDLPRAPLPDPQTPGAGPLPADMGRHAARPRAPHADPARGVPVADLQRAQPALAGDVPRRRRGRRHVATRGRAHRARALPPARRRDAARAARGGRGAGGAVRVALAAPGARALSCRAVATDDDPIRTLLAGCAPTLFLGNPAGTVAIMEDRVVEAGGDPDEVLAWVREHGGYPDKTFSVTTRHALSPRPRSPSKPYYVVPEDALK
jgi:hypothetical protein